MSEPTKEEMFNALADAVTGRMMSREMADAISDRLIESSGEKAGESERKPDPNVIPPKPVIVYEGFGAPSKKRQAKDQAELDKHWAETFPAPSPGPSVVEDELEEDDLIPLTPGELEGLKNPPFPKEVEEAMFRMEMFANCHGSKDEVADAAVIRAALRPKVVTRERVRYWIPCTCIDDYKLRDRTDPTCAYHTTAIGWEDLLNELGIEVEP